MEYANEIENMKTKMKDQTVTTCNGMKEFENNTITQTTT